MNEIEKKTKEELVGLSGKLITGLVTTLALVIWQAIDPTIWNSINEKIPSKVLWAIIGILVLAGGSYIYHLRRRLAGKDEASKDEQIASLKSENAALKEQTARLESEVNKLTHRDILPEIAEGVLLFITSQDEPIDANELEKRFEYLCKIKGIPRVNKITIEYHLEELYKHGYLKVVSGSYPVRYYIDQKGRKYYVENKERLSTPKQPAGEK